MAMINVDIISKVVRRYAYKGGLATHEALPVDATTVMGILLVMGSLLAAPGLPQKTLDQCVALLASMEEKSDLPLAWTLVPSNTTDGFTMEVNDNRISSKALRTMMQKLEIPWARPDSFNRCFISNSELSFTPNNSNSNYLVLVVAVVVIAIVVV